MEAGGQPVTGDTEYRDPRWSWPEYDRGTVVELRIHGVGGEGPEGMTRDHHPVRVGGSDDVGFWRARNPEVPGSPGHVREVLSWGGSTSGRSRSALWVLLLPFALFNAAGRMGPRCGRRRTTAHRVVCRLLALTITLSIVSMTAALVLDTVLLQCGAVAGCATAELNGRWLLAPLRWFADDAAAAVAVLALVPTAVPYLLRFAGRRTFGDRHVPGHSPDLGDEEDHALHAADVWLARWPAWRLRLAHVTSGYAFIVVMLAFVLAPLLPADTWVRPVGVGVGVGSLVVSAIAVAVPRTAATAPHALLHRVLLMTRWGTVATLGVLLGSGLGSAVRPVLAVGWVPVLSIAAAATFGWATWQHRRHGVTTMATHSASPSGPSGSVRDAAMLASLATAGVLTAGSTAQPVAVADALKTVRVVDPLFGPLLGSFPEVVYGPIWVLVGVQMLLLLALVATSIGRGTDRPGRHPLPVAAVPWNLTAPVVALISLLLVTAVGAGLHAFAVDWLGARVVSVGDLVEAAGVASGDAAAGDPRAAIGLAVPWWYVVTALVTVLTVPIIVGSAGIVLWWLRRHGPSPHVVREAVARSLAPMGTAGSKVSDVHDAEAIHEVVTATGLQWSWQGLVRRAGAALGVAVAIAAAGTGVAILAAASSDGGLERAWPLDTIVLLVAAAIPPTVVLVLRAARRDRAVRTQIAMLWDVLSFWPRTTHPFAPPSYGEAVVPAVVARVNAVPDTSPVVLAGHSQGSVVALAAAVHPGLVRRPAGLHLVTYGSPVATLYEGFFPTVFGGADGAIARATRPASVTPGLLASWHNVLTPTEPLGTPLWAASDPGGPASVIPDGTEPPDDSLGWPVMLRLPWAACPACGWRRTDRPITVATTAIDITITDPDRILGRTGQIDGRPEGHSCYHRSRELDQHLVHIAAEARRRTTA